VLEAAFWGFVGGFALLIGALIGIFFPTSQRTIGIVMAFGSGVLISALAFELTEQSFRIAGGDAVTLGLATGALSFYIGDLIIDRRGGNNRKRSGGEQSDGNALAIVVGALMDGIPESITIGVTLLTGGGVSIAVVVAVFMSNVPESLSAASGLQRAGHSTRWILGLWSAVVIVSTIAAAAGYVLLDGSSPDLIAFIQTYAAGAILVMLADTMMPEAFQHGGNVAGLVTVLGFALAFFLSQL
jgi:ZIP family zinc transporter